MAAVDLEDLNHLTESEDEILRYIVVGELMPTIAIINFTEMILAYQFLRRIRISIRHIKSCGFY